MPSTDWARCGVLTCHPVPVTVAQKEERARLDMVFHGMWTSETGRLEEVRVPEVVRDYYWVRAQDGTWYRVSADQFRAVEVGGRHRGALPLAGSRPTNDLYLRDREEPLNVSREHFAIDRGGSIPLHDGDVIIVGTSLSPYVFKFRVG
jgi:hypothetical protein